MGKVTRASGGVQLLQRLALPEQLLEAVGLAAGARRRSASRRDAQPQMEASSTRAADLDDGMAGEELHEGDRRGGGCSARGFMASVLKTKGGRHARTTSPAKRGRKTSGAGRKGGSRRRLAAVCVSRAPHAASGYPFLALRTRAYCGAM